MGMLHVKGRRDGQLKLRGQRLEAGHIVSVVDAIFPGTTSVVSFDSELGAEHLVLFIAGMDAPFSTRSIRSRLSERLPRFMVPTRVIVLDSFPLSTNGKVCMRTLRALASDYRQRVEVERIELTEGEAAVAQVWATVLGVADVGPEDDFFALGGDSILAIQLAAELLRRDLAIDVASIFRHPKLSEMAVVTASVVQEADPESAYVAFSMVPAEDSSLLDDGLEDAYPVTAMQAGMLFEGQLHDQSSVYHDVFAFDLEFDYIHGIFASAVADVIAEHEILRTSFDLDSYSTGMQLVWPEVDVPVESTDISAMDATAQDTVVANYVQRRLREGFSHGARTLVRFAMFERGDSRYRLVIDAHHAILDGWSMALLQRQVFETYWSLRHGIPRLSVANKRGRRFAEFVAAERHDLGQHRVRDFWSSVWRDLPRSRPLLTSVRDTYRTQQIRLATDLVEALRVLGGREAISLRRFLLLAHLHALDAMHVGDGVVSGYTDNGRLEAAGSEAVLGLFLNILPVGMHGSNTTWRRELERIGRDEVESKPFRRYPYSAMLRHTGGKRLRYLFTYTNFHPVRDLQDDDRLSLGDFELREHTDFDISCLVNGNFDTGLTVFLTSRLELPQAGLAGLGRRFVEALQAMVRGLDDAIPRGGMRCPGGGCW